VLSLSSTGLWPALGYLAILIVTLPLALLPLGLTAGYNYVWLKLRAKLISLLPRLRREGRKGGTAATAAAKVAS
jgi:hypothetical protein